jgi:Mrp family chromosome partitioning ATPase
MNEISWEDPYRLYKKKWGLKRNVDSDNFENGDALSDSQSNSFADRFLAGSQEKSTASWSDLPAGTYRDYHHAFPDQEAVRQSPPVMGSYEPVMTAPDCDRDFAQPHGAYHGHSPAHTGSAGDSGTIHRGRYLQSGQQESFSEKWHFFDLKSRKQTGDLYKKILSYHKKNNYKAFCFTSTTPKEGVTTILANLAHYIRFQGSGHHVLLVDANLDSPGMNNIFGIPAHSPGLIEVLERKIDLESVLVPVGGNISVLCSGNVGNIKPNSLDPEEYFNLIQECKALADYLIIDCPPILVSSDVFSVAPASDITFLVVQAVKVRRQVAEKGISELRNNECEIGGIIMNRVHQVIPGWVYKFI